MFDHLAQLPMEQKKRTTREWLRELWIEIKAMLAEMFWIPPAYPDPVDDTPHLPFAQWEALRDQGKVEPLKEAESKRSRRRSYDSQSSVDGLAFSEPAHVETGSSFERAVGAAEGIKRDADASCLNEDEGIEI